MTRKRFRWKYVRRQSVCQCKGKAFLPFFAKCINKLSNFKMQERVSRQELREMRVGQTRIFTLDDKKKIMSARVQAYTLKNEEDLEFEVRADYSSSSVSITRTR